MDWISASLIMFCSSVVMYLLVRKSSLQGTHAQINNLAMFLIPLVVYTAIGIFTGVSFVFTSEQYILIFITALGFCFLGNVLSLKGIAIAPNPGYSLVISKSYVLFTTIVAIVFFQSSLSLIKLAAIISIVIFSSLILLGKSNKKAKGGWVAYSIGAFLCWGMLSLASKYILNQNINIFSYLSILYFFVSIFTLLGLVRERVPIGNIRRNTKMILGIGVISSVFNICMFYAVSLAPNLGYVNAINVSSISMVTLLASRFFGDELNFRKVLGVIGVIAGSIFLLV